jgi:dTMP kinase
MARARGRYYIIEGPDLVGKSTVADRLGRWLYERQIKHIITPQPGATRLGGRLRQIIKHDKEITLGTETEAMMFVLDHLAFVEDLLYGQREEWIISDRNNYISALVYQALRGVNISRLDLFYSIVPTTKADGIFILNASEKNLAVRAKQRPEVWDRYESNAKFMKAVHETYATLAKDHYGRLQAMLAPEGVIAEIDANADIDTVMKEVINIIDKQQI